MARGERPLDGSDDSALVRFAEDLRQLRKKAGNPTYQQLAERAHYSVASLSTAANGRKLPTLAVTLAYVRACDGDASTWEQRWHAVAAELAQATETAVAQGVGSDRSPYVGLAAFQLEDSDRFFGRERQVDDLVARLSRQRFVAVFGASGVGKSSLLRAGLAVRWSTGSANRSVMVFTPGAHPLEECAIQFGRLTACAPGQLLADLAADRDNLHRIVRQALAGQPDDAELLVVVDQFEEIFTVCRDETERLQFVRSLLTAANADNARCRVVLGIRADFYAHCTRHAELLDALDEAQVAIGAMTVEELRRAIVEPAKRANCVLEGALLAELMAHTDGRDSVLPMLSHALLETWRRRRGNTLTLTGFQAAGGIRGALARTAESVYTSLDPDQQRLVKELLLRLTALGEGTEDTKRRTNRSELTEGMEPVLAVLAEYRLVTLADFTVEIAHEALIGAWPRLRQWLTADRDGLRVHRQLTESTLGWSSLQQDSGALYRGARLAAAREWADRDGGLGKLNALERAFLAASVRHERRAVWMRRVAVALVAVLAVVATGFAVLAVAQRDDAQFRQVVAEADRLQAIDPSLSGQLALVAHRMRPDDEGVHTRLLATQHTPLATPLTGHTGAVYLTTFNPDGRTLATASNDNTVRLWDVQDRTHPRPLGSPITGHTSWVSAAVFSPDGRTLATAGNGHTIRLWNVTAPAAPVPLGPALTGHNGTIYLIAFSPDGKTLVSANDDHTARLWDVRDSARPVSLGQPLTGHSGAIRAVAFSPNGQSLAIGGDDAAVTLWDVADPSHPARLPTPPLTGHDDTVHSVAFSPDSRILASASEDMTVRLWNVADPSHPTSLGRPLARHAGAVWSVAFSPDGQLLGTGSADRTARLWNITNPSQAEPIGQPLAGGTGIVFAVGFSPDGRTLATGSDDGRARLWSIPRTIMVGHTSAVKSPRFSQDGRILASGSEDGTVRLWNVTNLAAPNRSVHLC